MYTADERGLLQLQKDHRWVLLRGTFFPQLQTSALFRKQFLLSECCANFLEWLAELAENSWNFSRSIQTPSLTHTCPACVSIQFHTGDIQVLGNCTQLTNADFFHCDKITGACCFEERSFRLRTSALFSEELSSLRILREFSRVARRTCKKNSEFSLFLSTSQLLTPSCPPVHHALLLT